MRYNVENLNSKQYIQFPKDLITSQKYRGLSSNAKVIYCVLHDRLSFSSQNNWVDENGDIYIYFPADKIAEITGVSIRTVKRALIDLKEYGLIESQKTDRANKYYINVAEEQCQNDTDNGAKMARDKCQNDTDNGAKMARDKCQNGTDNGAKMARDKCQNGTLLRLYNKTHIKNNKYPTDTRKRAHEDTPYQEIVGMFNETCTDLPQVKTLSDSRKRAIKARFKELDKDTDKIRELFEKVQQSDFLTGRKEGSDWQAGFDWIMKPSNMPKILEGNYDNRESSNGREVNNYAEYDYSEYEEYERNQRMPWE
jgi:DNA-binding transcriptional ArsR family regulator